MKNCKNHNWMILLCIAPILLFILLKLFFPTFAYLSLLGLLICPIAMAFMMYSMNKEKKSGHDEKKSPLHKNKKLHNVIIILIVVIIGASFFYVANLFSSESGVRIEKPLTYCQPQDAPPEQQKCFYTAHDHFQLKLTVNGEEQEILFEKGDLQGGHTHAQKGKIHWHSLLPIDPFTKNVTDWNQHSLKAVLQELGFTSLVGKNVIVIVNGKVEEKGLDYIWKDGDSIEVRFG